MTTTELENVLQLFDSYFRGANINVLEEFKCGSCQKLLSEPYQIRCGCRYCLTCIDVMINKGKKNCPGKNILVCGNTPLSANHFDCKMYSRIMKLKKGLKEKGPYEFEVQELRRKELENREEIKKLKAENVDLKNRFENLEKMFYDKIVKSKSELEEEMKAEIVEQENRFEKQEQEMKAIKSELIDKIDNKIDEIKNSNQEEIKSIYDKVTKLAINFETNRKGLFEMVIDNVDQLKTEFFYEKCSEYFHALMFYKLKLRICSTCRDQLCIYLHLYYDENNRYFRFPFQADVTMNIISKNKREMIKSITQPCKIKKPENNLFNEIHKFVYSISELTESGILESNCFIVQCCVKLK